GLEVTRDAHAVRSAREHRSDVPGELAERRASLRAADPAEARLGGQGRELEDVEGGLLVRVRGAHRRDDGGACTTRGDHLEARLAHGLAAADLADRGRGAGERLEGARP